MEEEKKKIININIAETIRILYADRKKICIFSFIAGLIGVALAFVNPKVYKSTVILAPEESGQGFSGSISSLASLVGMNLKIGQTGDALYPEIYPDLMGSTGFIVGLFPVKVTKSKTNETYSYMEYIQKHKKPTIPEYPKAIIDTILEKMSDDDKTCPNHQVNPRHLTKKEEEIAKKIKRSIACSVDKKTNVITIVVKDQDPLVAAIIADSVQVHLQQAITDYRTKKARTDLEYMQKLFSDAQVQYTKARQVYAAYCDANSNVVLHSVQSKIDDMENEMQLKYHIYQQVTEQLQLAKAKVQERTPAFTIVQEATIPNKHSGFPKVIILIIWMFLGFTLRSGMLAWKNHEKIISL